MDRSAFGRRCAWVVCALGWSACSYDFGGGAGLGGASSVASGGGGRGSTAPSSAASEASAGTNATGAASTASRASVASSSTTGFTPDAMTPCYADDFSNFGNQGWTEHEFEGGNTVGLIGGADVRVTAPGGASRPVDTARCFISVTFEPEPDADIFLEVREQGADAFVLRQQPTDGIGLFEGEAAEPILHGQRDLEDIDALALVFEPSTIFGFARASAQWTLVGQMPRPVWFDASGERMGFGIATTTDVTVLFHDFSLATPF